MCQFFPDGEPPVKQKPTLPDKGGCMDGWWPYAGYCYKKFGYVGGDTYNKENFLTFLAANSTCNNEWQGAQLAIMPSAQHNAFVSSLMGPYQGGENPWVGIYNWAQYDYYFRYFTKLIL